jgi:hypothetical protein
VKGSFNSAEMLVPIKIIRRERLQNNQHASAPFSVRIVGSGEHETVIFVTPFSAGAKNLA